MDTIPTDLRLVFFGITGAGISSIGNSVLGYTHFKTGVFARSCTAQPEIATTERLGRNIVVVDLPGISEETGISTSKIILDACSLCPPGPNSFVLVLKIGRFTESHSTLMKELVENFGEIFFNYLIVAFTFADDLEYENMEFQTYLDYCPSFLKYVKRSVNNRFLPVNNKASGERKIEFCTQLFAMVDGMIDSDIQKCYKMEMALSALQQQKQKEEEERRQQETRLKRERDEFELSVKAKYAKVISDKLEEVRTLQQVRSEVVDQGQQGSVQYTDRWTRLKLRLFTSRQHQHQHQYQEDDQMMEAGAERGDVDEGREELAAFESRVNEYIHMKEVKVRKMQHMSERCRFPDQIGEHRNRRQALEEHIARIATLVEETIEREQTLKSLKTVGRSQSENDLVNIVDVPGQFSKRRDTCVLS